MIPPSELILNADGSIYHLNLLPEDIAEKIIFVGDPDRVPIVSANFDSIRVKKGKREFITHTGSYQGKEVSVISTGIGTDNIDIVLNELDALANIDLDKRLIYSTLKSLEIVRIGTSGSIQEDIDIDNVLVSEYAIGMDGLMNFYYFIPRTDESDIAIAFEEYLMNSDIQMAIPYCFGAHTEMLKKFSEFKKGITLTNSGFYAPQGRMLRAEPVQDGYIDLIQEFDSKYGKITNFEMETAGIYGLSSVLGHKAVSLNLILANRPKGEFSEHYELKMNELIRNVLDVI